MDFETTKTIISGAYNYFPLSSILPETKKLKLTKINKNIGFKIKLIDLFRLHSSELCGLDDLSLPSF